MQHLYLPSRECDIAALLKPKRRLHWRRLQMRLLLWQVEVCWPLLAGSDWCGGKGRTRCPLCPFFCDAVIISSQLGLHRAPPRPPGWSGSHHTHTHADNQHQQLRATIFHTHMPTHATLTHSQHTPCLQCLPAVCPLRRMAVDAADDDRVSLSEVAAESPALQLLLLHVHLLFFLLPSRLLLLWLFP